ncbi:MAG: NUDIX domain-containing protein [Bacilli bacterium]
MKTILTNMCLLADGDRYLVQNRVSAKWPGLTLPGGHIEENETVLESVQREMKEETNLNVRNLEAVGFYEWFNPSLDTREIAFLYRSSAFEGTLQSSKEGSMLWLTKEEFHQYPWSLDFDHILTMFFPCDDEIKPKILTKKMENHHET